MISKIAAITGANSYTGKYIARLLMKEGWAIRNITGHPNRSSANSFDTYLLDFPSYHEGK